MAWSNQLLGDILIPCIDKHKKIIHIYPKRLITTMKANVLLLKQQLPVVYNRQFYCCEATEVMDFQEVIKQNSIKSYRVSAPSESLQIRKLQIHARFNRRLIRLPVFVALDKQLLASILVRSFWNDKLDLSIKGNNVAINLEVLDLGDDRFICGTPFENTSFGRPVVLKIRCCNRTAVDVGWGSVSTSHPSIF